MSQPIVYLAFAAALFGSAGAAVAQEATAPVHHAHGHRHRAMSHGQAIAPLPPAAGTRVADRTTPAPVPNESVSPLTRLHRRRSWHQVRSSSIIRPWVTAT